MKSGIMSREVYHPVLDCFMRGLPYAYRNVDAPIGAMVQFSISGECGGDWFLVKQETSWKLVKESSEPALSQVTIPQEIAWRVFTRGIDPAEARSQSTIEGDQSLASGVFDLTAIVA